VTGCAFAVFAPNAEAVSVMGEWNGWDKASHPLQPRADSGVWEGFVAGVGVGAVYKYHVISRHGGYRADKADPYAFAAEMPGLRRQRLGLRRTTPKCLGTGRARVAVGGAGAPCPSCNVPAEGDAPRRPDGFRVEIDKDGWRH